MAISEVKALLDMLKMAGSVASGIKTGYYRASDEMKDFPRQVQRLNEIAEHWEERLKKFPLPTDCHVQTRLDTAKELLEQEVERMDQINHSCCLMLCNKVAFPDQLTSNMKLVIQCFDDIPKSLQDRRVMDQLVDYEANKMLAPFSFTSDKKYVPIKTTVEDLRRALEDDTSDHNVVLLHGESGQGKSTMAKYLALLYHQESSLKITSDSTSASSTSRYFSEVHFIACGKNADSTFLIKKLWSELDYQTVDESGGGPLQTMEGGEQAHIRDHPAIAKSEIETTRRKIMARLENRERTLIVLDDVWEQSVVQDLHMSHKSIKYLITTQKSHLWPDVVRSVPIANPTPEEAKCILANHIVGWVLNESFPPEVQEEVDRLVLEVDRKPFILATIATSVTSKAEAMDPQTWKELRRNLVATLKQLPVDASTGKPIIFGEPYESNVVASMTMAIDSFTEKTRILFFLVVLFTEEVELEKTVLQVLFKAFFGTLYNFRSSFQHLANSSFVSINTTELPWRKEPLIGCSTHDLRRQFVGEMKQADAVIQKLVSLEEEIHPDEDEKELSVVICYLYGNKDCRRRAYEALRESRFEICADLQRDEKDESWINTNAVAFVRGWILLLAPDMDDNETDTRWEKRRHETAKKVILHLLKCGELHDEEVANLLTDSRTRLDTCYVLVYYAPFASRRMSIPVTVVALLETVKDFFRMKDVSLSSLGVMTSAMEGILVRGADAGIHKHIQKNSSMIVDILKGYIKMLADESNPECQSQVAEALQMFTSSKEISKILAACTEALDVLVGLINQRTSLFILQNLTNMFHNIFRKGMEVEEGVNSNYINRVIKNYIAIGSSADANPAYKMESTRALGNFTWQRLDILELLMTHLVRGEIDTLVFLNLVDKKSQSQSYEESVVGLFFYRILVESEAVDVKFQSNARENLISEFLKCYIGIFMDGIESESRIQALQVLSSLAESEEIRKLIVVNLRVIETAVELLQGQVSSSDLIILTDAIYNIYALEAQVDLKHIVPSRALTSILETYIGFLSLTDVDEVKLDLQTEAVRALGLFARRDEIRRLLMADLRLQGSLGRLLWTRKDVSPLLLRRMADLLFSFFVRRTEFATERENDVNCPLIVKALESFSRILMDDFKPEVQSEAIRGLGMLAARPDIRELIVGYQRALMRSVELLTETATTSILSNVRDAVDLISAKGPNPEDLDEGTADFRSATLRGYVAILIGDVPMQLQLAASEALSELLVYRDNRRLFSLACPDGLNSLKFLLDRQYQSSSDWPFNCRFYASVALTLIDPSDKSLWRLWRLWSLMLRHSAEGYFGRGRGQMLLGMFENAVVNFDKAIRMVPNFTWALCDRAAARVQLGNAAGALEDLNDVLLIKKYRYRPVYLQERGVVKRIMRDHEGALADFNKSLALERNDYEMLKQRGYVKFLLGDETGARADAERAILVIPVSNFRPYSIIQRRSCLGMWPVEFLGFQLR